MFIAITGGIGTGKSTVLSQFQHFGARTLDADDVAHQLYLPKQPAFDPIVRHWGTSILSEDGTLDRKKIAQIVFQDSAERDWLNGLMHPLIRDAMEKQASASPEPLFCAIPLLFESGWESSADAVIAVWCDRQTQMARLLQRGWSRQHAEDRLASQWTPDEKMRKADYAILTRCSWDHLAEQCRRIHDSICRKGILRSST